MPSLSNLFPGSDDYKLIELEDGVFAAVIPNEDGVVDRVCLVRDGSVIVAVEMYGNGNAIDIPSDNHPALSVNQSKDGLTMIFTRDNPDRSKTYIYYGSDGRIVDEHNVEAKNPGKYLTK